MCACLNPECLLRPPLLSAGHKGTLESHRERAQKPAVGARGAGAAVYPGEQPAGQLRLVPGGPVACSSYRLSRKPVACSVEGPGLTQQIPGGEQFAHLAPQAHPPASILFLYMHESSKNYYVHIGKKSWRPESK